YHTKYSFFFFTDPSTSEIYTLSLHDALPISARPARQKTTRHPPRERRCRGTRSDRSSGETRMPRQAFGSDRARTHIIRRMFKIRSEEHTSELQSRRDLVCRLLLEKKKKNKNY